MAFFLTLALWALSFAATALLAPRPRVENAKAAELGDFGLPDTEEGTPVPLFWGRVRMRGPKVLWYGDLEARPITQKVKTGLFSSKRVTVGHEYFVGIHFGFGLLSSSSAGVRFLKIWSDEDVIWQGDVTPVSTGTAVQINEPELYGGRESGGGFISTVRLHSGNTGQTVNSYLAGVVPDSSLLPAYRGLAHAVFEKANVGEQPSVRALSFEVEHIPTALGLGAVNSEGDVNPAEVLWDILTSDWGRLDIDPSLIDIASFTAAGNTLATEENGISIQVANPNDARDVIQEVLTQIDGLLYEEPGTRRIFLRLIRDDYSIPSLPVFNESNVIEVVKYSVSTWAETTNQVRIVFDSRAEDYNDKTAFAQDMANINAQEEVRSAEFNYPGVKTATLANQLVARELNLLSIPLTTMRLNTNRDGANLRPGDVLVFNWPDFGVDGLVMRVQRFDLGQLENGRIAVDLIQDRFAVSHTVYSDPPTTQFVPPVTDATPVQRQDLLEMPRWVGLQAVAAEEVNSADNSRLMYLAAPPAPPAGGVPMVDYDAQVSDDNVSFSTDLEDVAFADSALVAQAYPADTDAYDTTQGLVLKAVSDTSLLTNIVLQDDIAVRGQNLLLVGQEIIAYESFVDNGDGTFTLQNVWRRLLDTVPASHAVDEVVWFLTDLGLESLSATVFEQGDTVDVRYITDTVFKKLNPSLATLIDDFPVTGRPTLPYPPADLNVNLEPAPPEVYSLDVDLAWLRRDRLNQEILRQDAADEVPGDDASDTFPTRHVASVRIDAGAVEETLLPGTSGTVTLSSFGQVELELRAERNQDPLLRSLFPVTRSFAAVDPTPTDSLSYDTYPSITPAGAWGLRRMISTYVGPAVRVRDTSDDSEQDIFFDVNGDLNTFTVVGSAAVTTLYDQTGNANHLLQATPAAQPILNPSGTANGSPAIEFDGTNDQLKTADFLGSSGNPLLVARPVMLWAGEFAADNGGLGELNSEYGITTGAGGLVTQYKNGQVNNETYVDPGAPGGAWSLISQLGLAGDTVWQESENDVFMTSPTNLPMNYVQAAAHNFQVGSNTTDTTFGASTLYEVSIHSGEMPGPARQAAFNTPLTSYWRI